MFTHLDAKLEEVVALVDKIDRVLGEKFERPELQELADFALLTIVRRTKAGKAVHGRNFVRYSPSTQKAKVRQGRSTTVDLQNTGKMLGNMAAGVEGHRAVVYFPDPAQGRKAYFLNKGTRRMKRRRFMHLMKKEFAQANQMAMAMILKRLGAQ